MKKLTILSLSAIALCGCVAQSEQFRQKTFLISNGDSKQSVIEAMGAPQNRVINGSLEALQYCQTGMASDTYVTFILKDGQVTHVDMDDTMIVDGFCHARFPAVAWNSGHEYNLYDRSPMQIRAAEYERNAAIANSGRVNIQQNVNVDVVK